MFGWESLIGEMNIETIFDDGVISKFQTGDIALISSYIKIKPNTS
jgi:hypothetical protein